MFCEPKIPPECLLSTCFLPIFSLGKTKVYLSCAVERIIIPSPPFLLWLSISVGVVSMYPRANLCLHCLPLDWEPCLSVNQRWAVEHQMTTNGDAKLHLKKIDSSLGIQWTHTNNESCPCSPQTLMAKPNFSYSRLT